ncbi:helix-turn-helix domain-containing protein [Ramlibacter sp. AN1133]|uniref:helix-turn-helix domain-containing protein n=1 Tax=Ramlibacter sp. AN1133 TaxID=3133429 RepID=UPI0030C4C501
MKVTDSAAQLRAALAVLLPAQQGLSLTQTAAALGRNPTWVSRTRNAYMEGQAHFAGLEARGGRRGGMMASLEMEVSLVKEAILKSADTGRSVRQQMRELLVKQRGTDPSPSTITAILERTAPRLLSNGNAREVERWSARLAEVYKAEAELDFWRSPAKRRN